MKSIGDQVREFREGKKWDKPTLAAEIARHEGAKHVRRQHIEQLETATNRIPKYLGQLAAVMGTTADAILVEAGLAPKNPKRAPAPPSGPLADRLREELEMDPYEVIERGLAALLIVSHAKDKIMQAVREAAEVAAEGRRMWEQSMRSREKE